MCAHGRACRGRGRARADPAARRRAGVVRRTRLRWRRHARDRRTRARAAGTGPASLRRQDRPVARGRVCFLRRAGRRAVGEPFQGSVVGRFRARAVRALDDGAAGAARAAAGDRARAARARRAPHVVARGAACEPGAGRLRRRLRRRARSRCTHGSSACAVVARDHDLRAAGVRTGMAGRTRHGVRCEVDRAGRATRVGRIARGSAVARSPRSVRGRSQQRPRAGQASLAIRRGAC